MVLDETSRKTRPRTRIQKRNIERILDAALEVFAQGGFSGATLDQIAETAGMSKPNLLYYYGSKKDLYLATLQRILDMWLDPLGSLGSLDPESEPADAIRAYIRRKIASSRSDPLASRVFVNEIIHGAPVLRPVLEGRLKSMVDEKARILRQWMDQGALARVDPYHLIFALWAVTQHYADFAAQIEAIRGRGLDDEAFYRETETAVLDLFLGGLLPREGKTGD